MAAVYNGVPLPSDGAPIGYDNAQYQVPNNPIIPYIEGDGTGRDIWKAKSTAGRKSDLLIMTGDTSKLRVGGLTLAVSPFRSNTLSPLAGIKSLNYLDQVLACGDSANDRDMLCLGGPAVAVANAHAELTESGLPATVLRARASYADGVVEALRHYGWL